jgi:hypothetical protein
MLLVKAGIKKEFTIIHQAEHWIESQHVQEGTNVEQRVFDSCPQAHRISGVIGLRASDVI